MALLRGLRRVDSVHLGRLLRSMGESWLGVVVLRHSLTRRKIVEALFPSDPLGGCSDLPSIEIVLPCAVKDLPMAPLALAAAIRSSRNPVARVRMVVPRGVEVGFDDIGVPLVVEHDDDVIGVGVLGGVDRLVARGRRGWVIQQLAKIKAVMASQSDGCLVLDADTLLVRPRTWLDRDGRQILAVSHEFHAPYVHHAERVWAGRQPSLSFVTHHQLMQPAVVRAMFPRGDESLLAWLDAADWTESSAVSEYHDYGSWLSRSLPERAVWVCWRNETFAFDERALGPRSVDSSLDSLGRQFPRALSLSSHRYLDGPGPVVRDDAH